MRPVQIARCPTFARSSTRACAACASACRDTFLRHPYLTSDVLDGIDNTIGVLREAGARVEDIELPEQKLFAAARA